MRGLHSEFTVTAEGRDWRLRLDFNALAEFEQASGADALQALEGMLGNRLSVLHLRRLIWAMLQRHHPGATLTDAGDIMSADMSGVMAGIAAAMPQGDGDAVGGDLGNAASPVRPGAASH